MLETPLEQTLCTCCCQSVSGHNQADTFSGSVFLYCTAKELPKEFQTILHSWESLVTGSDVGVCVNTVLFSWQSSCHAMHSALPWISQAAQIAGQCRAVFSNSDRSQKPSAAGPEFCQLNSAAGVGQGSAAAAPAPSAALRELRVLPVGRTGRELGTLALLGWHWLLLTDSCSMPREHHRFCR